MTPDELARIHAASFTTPRPWSAEEFADLLNDPTCTLIAGEMGFALIRSIADEAELLTIAVAPEARRAGIGRVILGRALDAARQRGAARMFLEVAADNTAAIALYQTGGFAQAGRRRGYYRRPDGSRADALVMNRNL